ncbi:MAG: phage tail tape measure protein [Mesorhizobium sp.]|nr:phage tail tape measure protein [Mesorhizobium sp.]MBN9220220.1 phage tail tape measure protein [Mesorhizobium sp.]
MANLVSQLLVKLIDGVSAPARAAARSLAGIGNAARQINGVQVRLRDAIERNNLALDRARSRMLDAVAAGYVLKRGLEAPLQAAMQFESAMADVRKVVDFDSVQQFKDFQKEVIGLSKRLPMAADGLSQIVAAAGQAGIARDDLLKFTEMAAKVGVAFDMSADQTGDALAKMMTGLGLSIDQMQLLADAMNYLSNEQASSAADILDVVRRVGATSKQFGFNAVQVSAFASAMLSAGAESDVAATSFRNMGRALTKGASATKAQRRAYSRLGLDARKVAKAMQKDAVGTTVKVLEKISQLPKDVQASISSDLFGDEARALGPLLTNLELLKKSLGMVANEIDYAGSSTKEYEVRAKTFANNLQLFKNRLTAVGIQIGNALIPPLTQLMDTIAPLIDKLADFAAAYPDLTAKIVGATAALLAFRIAMTGLSFLGLIGKGGALSLLAGSLAVISKAGTPVLGFFETLALRAQLATSATGKAPGVFARLGDAMLVLGRGLTSFPMGVLRTAGSLLARFGLWGAAAAGAGYLIYQNWSGLGEFFSGFVAKFEAGLAPLNDAIERIKTAFAPLAPVLQPVIDLVQRFVNPFGELIGYLAPLAGYLQASDAAWKSWGETLGGAVASALEGIAKAIERFIGGLNAAIEAAGRLGSSSGGADSSTFAAPARMWPPACSSVRKRPVESITRSTPASPQRIEPGSLSSKAATTRPSMRSAFASAAISPAKRPCTLSYFSR